MSAPFIIIDGSSWLFRAFHALPPLTGPEGQPTGAVYGMGNMLRKLLGEYAPQHMAVVFDARGKTFRHELYPDYKANRPPAPEDLIAQIDDVKTLVDTLGIARIEVEGVEADDVIASLTRQAREKREPVLIVSSDKDLTQLVGNDVAMLDTMKNVTLDAAAVEDKYGVPPARIGDWLSLVGDTSDNVPGVPGVGPKTASRWLAEYGSLDELIAQADSIKGKAGEKLRDAIGAVRLSRELVALRDDVNVDEAACAVRGPDGAAFQELAQRLGFKRWLDAEEEQRTASVAPATEDVTLDVRTVVSQGSLQELVAELEGASAFAFDCETDGLDPRQAALVGLSFSSCAGRGWYVPVGHRYPGAPDQLPLEEVVASLGPLLEDEGRAKIAQNGKFDLHVLERHGLPVRGLQFDTMLESFVIEAGLSRHDMDTLAQRHLGRTTIKFADVAGRGRKQLTFDQVGIEEASAYAAEDAEVTLALHESLWPQLQGDADLKRVYSEIEQPLIEVLQTVERNGVRVDAQRLRELSQQFGARMQAIDTDIAQRAGESLNLNSPAQLGQLLFETLQLPVLSRTPKGQPSTAESVLSELAETHEIPALILEYRGLSKLKSTYTDKLPEAINPHTGRVHTSYHQAGAATGRLSSADPNLQNIPIKSESGRLIREAFVADDGNTLISLDYSQIELRLMAHMAGDSSLIQAFTEDRDVHSITASEMFGVPLEDVDASHRRAAKAINFGLIYGISAFGLARQLGIGRQEAQDYIERFFGRYPRVRDFMEHCKDSARESGYAKTLYGRRLYLPELGARNKSRQQGAERVAINAPLQGTAADLIKLAMIQIHERLRSEDAVRMILQVHDELVFEVPAAQGDRWGKILQTDMENVAQLDVPLKVEWSSGANWNEAHG